jgi:hypothetical protein
MLTSKKLNHFKGDSTLDRLILVNDLSRDRPIVSIARHLIGKQLGNLPAELKANIAGTVDRKSTSSQP